MTLNRRTFTTGVLAGAGALAAGFPRFSIAQAKAKVVVIGGGAGGATAARYIARDLAEKIEVTLVEPSRAFTTCFFSNLYVGGFRSFDSITHTYAKVGAGGVALAHDMASAIDRAKREVTLAGGQRLAYDRLVVSPGIDLKWDSVPGWSEAAAAVMPHAWTPGAQTRLLRAKLDAVKDGETIVMTVPNNPYRCPPGPYERVSMFAWQLKSTGRTKTKIVVIDAKAAFSKQAVFQEGWEKHYPGMVVWMDPKMHGGLKAVDPAAMTVTTDLETIKAGMVNVIPAQWAGKIARDAGLANESGYCPINPESMASTVDPNVFVIGDACVPGDMPKSAFSANSQAKVAALAVRGALAGQQVFPARYANTCWSLIAAGDDIKIGGRYEAKDGKITALDTFVSKPGEEAALRMQNYEESLGWYAGITADMFG
ncbi:MAG: NAD(P)/FAD-dependent oxidoreductase [Alphaproteobacteria bacterium]|nr:NAD(P)/FAD-dependent oxidoreductase [Alphaproteobacteria bacterium]